MQNADWIALLRQIPAELHTNLVLALNNRTEISVEVLFRLEPTFAVVRGRLGGTTEGGLLFMVPYDQLTTLYCFKELKEADVETIFGAPKVPAQALPRSANGTAPAVAAPAGPVAVPSFGRPPEATAVARNNLLERLRAARQAAMPPQNGK